MNERTEQKIGVVGGGLMGHGIAYLFAASGHHVNVFEPFPGVRASLPQRLRAIVELLGDDPRLLTRIAAHDSLASAMQGADWIFEAAPEKLPLKQEIFAAIEKLVAPTTVLASNSSAIPSTEIGRHLAHRERMVGTHFWNPPHLVPLVETRRDQRDRFTFHCVLQPVADKSRNVATDGAPAPSRRVAAVAWFAPRPHRWSSRFE